MTGADGLANQISPTRSADPYLTLCLWLCLQALTVALYVNTIRDPQLHPLFDLISQPKRTMSQQYLRIDLRNHRTNAINQKQLIQLTQGNGTEHNMLESIHFLRLPRVLVVQPVNDIFKAL